MIVKKCMTCGTLHPVDHVTDCDVCDEDNWSVTCDKHHKLKLKKTSSCPECKAEEEAAKIPKEERKRTEEERRRKAATKKRKKPPVTRCPHGHGLLLGSWGDRGGGIGKEQMYCLTCGWMPESGGKREKPDAEGDSPLKTSYCPFGHGRLREWDGQMRCWKCGWPEKISFEGVANYFWGVAFLIIVILALANNC
jgi:hypothetical protein